jgi:hypothetical protein
MATQSPVAIAQRLRAQKRVALRIAFVTLPIAIPGILLLVFADDWFPPSVSEVVAGIAGVLFLIGWFAVMALAVIRFRDFRNRLRSGSAAAYEDE